jgi:hypothetical protein
MHVAICGGIITFTKYCITIVNISLLLNVPEARSERLKRKSSTVSSDQE